jgi:hypothetical protein
MTTMAQEVREFFEQDGMRRALSRRRGRSQPVQRVGARETTARRNEKTGARLEISERDNAWPADVVRTSQAEPLSRTASFHAGLLSSLVDPLFVEGHPAADDRHDEPPDLHRYLRVI